MSDSKWKHSRAEGIVAFRTGCFEEADRLLTDALAEAGRVFGEHDIRTACSHADLAYLFRRVQQEAKAERHFKRAIVLTERQRGKSSPFAWQLTTELASLYAQTSRLPQATVLLEQLHRDIKGTSWSDQSLQLRVLNELVTLYLIQNRVSDSRPLLTQIAALRSHQHGEPCSDEVAYVREIAERFASKGDLARAARIGQIALELHTREVGAEHAAVACDLVSLAGFDCLTGELDQAQVKLERALEIRRKLHGERSKPVIETYLSLASLSLAGEDYDAAIATYDRVLELCADAEGTESLTAARTLHRLALLTAEAGRAEQSCNYLNRALTAYECVPETSPDLIAFYKDAADLLASMGQKERAQELESRVRQALTLVADHPAGSPAAPMVSVAGP